MLCTQKISYEEREDRENVINLYLSAFPEVERRSLAAIESLWKEDGVCTFHGIYEDAEFVGFFSVWDCISFSFFEYVAIKEEKRGKGLASSIFLTLLQKYSPAICEVEIPELVKDSHMAKRRISFYEKLGWSILDVDYLLPPLKSEDIEFPFYLMSYGGLSGSVSDIVKRLYEVVYRVKKE
ncbi:MAG: GNAT family N-acetyltransferase [Desulfovibrionaceae bacterium]